MFSCLACCPVIMGLVSLYVIPNTWCCLIFCKCVSKLVFYCDLSSSCYWWCKDKQHQSVVIIPTVQICTYILHEVSYIYKIHISERDNTFMLESVHIHPIIIIKTIKYWWLEADWGEKNMLINGGLFSSILLKLLLSMEWPLLRCKCW